MSSQVSKKKTDSDSGEHAVEKNPGAHNVLHEVDGIQECDNDLPRWWLVTLFGTVAFAGFYWFNYQVFKFGQTTNAEYQDDVAEHAAIEAKQIKAAGVMTPEALVTLSHDRGTVANGHDVFVKTCAPCHKEDASGNVGPNLTDAYWIHGGAPDKVYGTISKGVMDKGMPAWGPQLGPERTQAVAAYVITLRNTNVPGKAPQGDNDP